MSSDQFPAQLPTLDMTEEDLYDLLRSELARDTIEALATLKGDRLDLDDLVNEISRWSSETPRGIRITLIQNHLPQLDQYGIIDYDHDAGIIELNESIVGAVQIVRLGREITVGVRDVDQE